MKKELLFSFIFFCSLRLFALNSSDISIRIISGSIFHSDHNQCLQNIGPRAVYIGLEVCNTSSFSLNNLQATLTDFSTIGFSLAGNQLATQNINNPLLVGHCDTLYWFCTYPCEDSQTKIIFDITDSDDGTSVSDTSDNMTSSRELSANAGGFITASQLSSNDTINYITCFNVLYGLSKLVNGDQVFLQPAANLDFNARCFQLERATVLSSQDNRTGCIPVGNCPLYYSITKTCGFSPLWSVEVEYCFKVQCQQTTSYLIPYASATSGNDLKYTIANSAIMLPVELLFFNAKPQDSYVNIGWETASEMNTLFFEVQKSDNAVDFYTINSVQAAGNSSTVQNYSVTDYVPYPVTYYRLKINNADGTSEYSAIAVAVIPEDALKAVSVYPNPATTYIYINFPDIVPASDMKEYTIELLDVSGKKVMESIHELKDNNINLSQVSSGMYMVKITSQNRVQISKLQVEK